MAIINYNGNIFNSKAGIICHQCNCKGVMGSGIALTIKNKYPEVFEAYTKEYHAHKLQLGHVLFVPVQSEPNRIIANLCGQDAYGRSGRFTNYNALRTCLNKVRVFALKNNIKSIAIPFNMSCCRAGGEWSVVYEMIEDILDKELCVEIWKL
ncbi:macro domain-containing protein [bacterium]|nr:macro domain-containing protein [bacterium]